MGVGPQRRLVVEIIAGDATRSRAAVAGDHQAKEGGNIDLAVVRRLRGPVDGPKPRRWRGLRLAHLAVEIGGDETRKRNGQQAARADAGAVGEKGLDDGARRLPMLLRNAEDFEQEGAVGVAIILAGIGGIILPVIRRHQVAAETADRHAGGAVESDAGAVAVHRPGLVRAIDEGMDRRSGCIVVDADRAAQSPARRRRQGRARRRARPPRRITRPERRAATTRRAGSRHQAPPVKGEPKAARPENLAEAAETPLPPWSRAPSRRRARRSARRRQRPRPAPRPPPSSARWPRRRPAAPCPGRRRGSGRSGICAS